MTLHIRPTPLTSGGLRDTGGSPSETEVGLAPRHRWVSRRDTGGSFSVTQVGIF